MYSRLVADENVPKIPAPSLATDVLELLKTQQIDQKVARHKEAEASIQPVQVSIHLTTEDIATRVLSPSC